MSAVSYASSYTGYAKTWHTEFISIFIFVFFLSNKYCIDSDLIILRGNTCSYSSAGGYSVIAL